MRTEEDSGEGKDMMISRKRRREPEHRTWKRWVSQIDGEFKGKTLSLLFWR